MASKIGPKEAALKALPGRGGSKPVIDKSIDRKAAAKIAREVKTDRRKAIKRSAGAKLVVKKPKAGDKTQSYEKKPRVTEAGRPLCRAEDVSAFMARKATKENPHGGASMEELCAHFQIGEKAMRAKIAYVRNVFNHTVDLESRYYDRGEAPKDAAP